MLIRNGSPKNHAAVITAQIKDAERIRAAVAYVTEKGAILIAKSLSTKRFELICGIELKKTTIAGIKVFLNKGAEVKIYEPRKGEGIFHPKLWLFSENQDHLSRVLIGSANLTGDGLSRNVETGILTTDEDILNDTEQFFEYLWNHTYAKKIDETNIDQLEEEIDKRETLKSQSKEVLSQIKEPEKQEQPDERENIILEYVKQWIDIPKKEEWHKLSRWRGWYIIPDHGYIDDEKILELASYLPHIKGEVDIREQSTDENWHDILEKFGDTKFSRERHKTKPRDLFIRTIKNYLINLGWAEHGITANGKKDKGTICLTELGKNIRRAEGDLTIIKSLYTEYFLDFDIWGFFIIQFTRKILLTVEYLRFEEFYYFVTHAYNENDLEMIIILIKIYRSLNDKSKSNFEEKFKEYFEKVKGSTATNVFGNYVKSKKHTLHAIGWCNGFTLDKDFTLRLSDERSD